jgi:hypothetical protein
MDKIYTPSLPPIEVKFDVCRFDRTLLPPYTISPSGYGNSEYANRYFFVPLYNLTADDPTTTVTRFLTSFKLFDNKTKIEQWKINFGDGEKAIGTIKAITALTSNVASNATASNGSPLTLQVQSTTDFPNSGLLIIDNEYFYYSSKTSTTFSVTQRGVVSTTAANHYAISGAYGNPAAMYNSSVQLVNETLHQYRYDGGFGSNGCLNASLTAIDTRGRRHATMQMVYPKAL